MKEGEASAVMTSFNRIGTRWTGGDSLIPNLVPPDTGNYQIGKYGRMRRAYLKEHRKVLYTNLMVEGTLFKHLSEIDQTCNERIERICSDMAKREGVTEALKASDPMEWGERVPVALKLRTDRAGRRDRRMNSIIRNRAEEIALTELVYA